MPKIVTKPEFDAACKAVWAEIEYQNGLSRRTEDEAKDPGGFFTLGRVYLRRGEEAWNDNAGNNKSIQFLQKLATIFVRGMIYCGVPPTQTETTKGCNRHTDCAAANKKWLAEHPKENFVPFSFHCHSEDCEDCFGS